MLDYPRSAVYAMLSAFLSPRMRLVCALCLLPLWAACAMVVDPDSLLLRCAHDADTGADDPCLAVGLHCIDGTCQACDSTVKETCNGLDDDCDDKIDEGHDGDNDGFTWCGGGIAELADCVPNDRSIHPPELRPDGTRGPAPMEACDGKDNDCDSRVDEDAKCAEMPSCKDIGCEPGKTCDADSGVCIVPREVGSGCKNDSDCKGGFCLRPGSFGLNAELMDNRCASACCADADCDAGSVCVASNTGARACLPANIVTDRRRAGGERCSESSQCASALCFDERCLERCYNDAACSGENVCVLSTPLSEPRIWLCASPPSSETSPPGARCSPFLASCRTGLCTAGAMGMECATACARDGDCPNGEVCAYTDVRTVLAVSTIPMCGRPSGAEEGTERLCCTNADCDAEQLCFPNPAEGSRYHMSCRKP
jgi:hypothetical protein